MAQQRLGIIMNGVTGRMGMNQHLIRSIVAIRAQGGVALRSGDRVMPDPILVGRNEAKLEQLAKAKRVPRIKTLRRALGLTQDEFATRYHIPLGTLRDWEQGAAEPDQAARAYLRVIARDPEAVRRALDHPPGAS